MSDTGGEKKKDIDEAWPDMDADTRAIFVGLARGLHEAIIEGSPDEGDQAASLDTMVSRLRWAGVEDTLETLGNVMNARGWAIVPKAKVDMAAVKGWTEEEGDEEGG